MNEFFALLHSGQSAFAVFFIDVVVFIATIMVARAVIFLIGYKATEIIDRAKRGGRPPKYLKSEGAPIQNRKGPVNVTSPSKKTK